MSVLREFQQGFAQALLKPATDFKAQPGAGFAVYRNTVTKGLLDVLRANFPTVLRLVDTACFDAVALEYLRERPPTQPALSLYGSEFPDFVGSSELAAQLPYLPDVARLDRLWSEAHFAASAPVLHAQQLASLSGQALSRLQLRLHPAARFVRCRHSAFTIWLANRPPAVPPATLEVMDDDEAALITRPHGAVQLEALSLTDFEFVCRLEAGETLGTAVATVLAAHPDIDITALLVKLLMAGAFVPANNEEKQS